VDLIMATILVPDGELLRLAGHMIGGARVDAPVGVDTVGCTSSQMKHSSRVGR
jgi:hypothetical protein